MARSHLKYKSKPKRTCLCFYIKKLVQGRDSNCDRGGKAAAGRQGHNLFCGRRGAPDMAWIWISAGYGLDMDICLIQVENMEGAVLYVCHRKG